MLDLKSDVCRCIVLNESWDCQELFVCVSTADDLLGPLELGCELVETDFVLDECVCRYFLSGLLS